MLFIRSSDVDKTYKQLIIENIAVVIRSALPSAVSLKFPRLRQSDRIYAGRTEVLLLFSSIPLNSL